MSKHRVVKSDFWVDDYFEDVAIKESHFFLYLLTNPDTNILGIYRTTIKRMSYDTGLSKLEVNSFLEIWAELDKVYFISSYIIMVNHQKHNIPNGKMRTGIKILIEKLPYGVIKFIMSKKSRIYDRLSIHYLDSMHRANKDKYKDTNKSKDKDKSKNVPLEIDEEEDNQPIITREEKMPFDLEIKEIVEHLNLICGTNYRTSTEKTRSLIKTRLSEKWTVEDFKIVIRKKHNQWAGTKDEQYLRPETLFGNKFEGYRNQPDISSQQNQQPELSSWQRNQSKNSGKLPSQLYEEKLQREAEEQRQNLLNVELGENDWEQVR